MLFDSHCHLTDERLIDDVEAVVERARAAGVDGLVTIASDVEDAARALALTERLEGVWATAGVHPHAASASTPTARARVAELAERPGVVAIGETGLDYYYDNAPRAAQRESFAWHLELARERGLPVVVHARSADEDAAAMVADAGPHVLGVLHCFASGEALLRAGLDAGWYVSFSGLVSFRSYDGAAHVRAVPSDRLLIETDSPYLAPVPMRGRTNEPAYVTHVCAAVAALRGQDPDRVARETAENARRFYSLED